MSEPLTAAVERIRATYELGFTGTATMALYGDLGRRVEAKRPELFERYVALAELVEDCAETDAPAAVASSLFDDLADLIGRGL